MYIMLADTTIDNRIWGSIQRKIAVVGSTVGTSASSAALQFAGADLSQPTSALPAGAGAGAAGTDGAVAASIVAPAAQPSPRPAALTDVAKAPPATTAAVWVWCAGQGRESEYPAGSAARLESAWCAWQRGDAGAEHAARHVDIGGGRHADLTKMRQIVTAEPHRTRRIRRIE